MERGLATSLGPAEVRWSVLEGRRWHRFLHPQWGDFTVAICADLLDPDPWRAFRGELLHLFLVAFNKDVKLYESLTWARAYENYVNLVSVNHGYRGGSFLWTPKRGHGRELARLRGQGLFLLADVNVPVKELYDAQQSGIDCAERRAAAEVQACVETKESEFKSPPPGFRRVVAERGVD